MAYLDSVFSSNKIIIKDKIYYLTLCRQINTEDPSFGAYFIYQSPTEDYTLGYSMNWRTDDDTLEDFNSILKVYKNLVEVNSRL